MTRKKVSRILVPLDGSKNSFRGLDYAIYLARQCGATITALHVIPLYPSWSDLARPLKTRMFRYAEEVMDRAEVTAARQGIVLRKKIVYGSVKSTIGGLVRGSKFDLVVIGARGFGPVKEMVLGSVSSAALHQSKTPILVVK